MNSITKINKAAIKTGIVLCCIINFHSSIIVAQNVKKTAESSVAINDSKYNTSTIGFVKNAGQVYDYNKNLASQVLYSLNADNSSIFLTTTGLTYSLIERNIQSVNQFQNANRSNAAAGCDDKNVARLDVQLIGAIISQQNITEQEYVNPVPVSYYGSNLPASSLSLRFCRQIIIKNVYPQIDWILKITSENKFKYDFIIHPGGDLNNIHLKYNGPQSIALNTNADEITATTPLGNITEGKLFCFVENDMHSVNASYNLNSDVITFNVSKYNNRQTLVIDPPVKMVLTWSTYYGGGSMNGGGGTICTGIKCDENFNRVYIVGYCYSNPFPNYNNGVSYYFSPSQAGSTIEAFISAFDQAGVQQWATYYMSTEFDAAFDVTTDNLGNVYMVGVTESHNPCAIGFLTQPLAGTSGGFCQSSNNGMYQFQEGFIVRFNSSGKLKWATLFGGDATDQVYNVTCDNNNNVFVTGITCSQSKIPFVKQNASGYFQGKTGGGTYGLIAGFDINTHLFWSTCFGNPGTDCRTITCDANNTIYVTGRQGSSVAFPYCPLPCAYNNCSGGSYAAVFYPGSKLKWCSSFQPGQHITDLVINKTDGTVLIAGYADSTSAFQWQNDANATGKTYFDNTYNGGDYDGFLILLNPNYSLKWSTLLGGNGNDQITAASISSTGKIFVTGYTDNTDNPLSGNFPLVNAGAPSYFQDNLLPNNPAQIFLASFDIKGLTDPHKLLWSTLVGDASTGRETVYDMDMCGKNLFITGSAFLEPQSPSFPLIHEANGFLQTAATPIVSGFNPSGCNGLILKFVNEEGGTMRQAEVIPGAVSHLYPNPASGQFIYLQNDNDKYTNAQFQIVDIGGKCIKNISNVFSDGTSIRIDLDGLARGYYFLSISNSEANEHLPFAKM